ncbi:MAG: tetratricopeptide repeat protein [Candidatus Thiodiazotropha sp. (ex Dulcina madagascariensis)]|nr:tetratricopeptide repeat protein [Candidatus Thiodiazotropha sp. (ex Dulcina madagascariensis)]
MKTTYLLVIIALCTCLISCDNHKKEDQQKTNQKLNTTTIDDILARGYKALGQGQLQLAETEFNKALLKLSHLPEAHIGLAKTYRQQEQYSQVEEQLRSVISTDPTYDEAWLELADFFEDLGDTSKAVEVLQAFVRYNPFSADGEHHLAEILEKQGSGLSIHHYKNAYLLAPKRYVGDWGKGSGTVSLSDSIELIKRRNFPVLIKGLELSLFTSINNMADPSNFEQILDANPYNVDVLLKLGSISEYKGLLANSSNPSTEEAEEVLSIFLKFIKDRRPMDMAAVYEILSGTKGKESAAIFLRRSIQLEQQYRPNNVRIQRRVRELTKLWPSAVPQVQTPLRDNDCQNLFTQLKSRATSLPSDTVDRLESCVEAEPQQFEWYLFLGLAITDKRKTVEHYRKSAEFLLRAVQLKPHNWSTWIALGQALMFSEQKDEAAAVASVVIKHASDQEMRKMAAQILRRCRTL